ncbi:MAG: hypothetical protein JXA73_12810 [Acidobacteria bacterium]|nr:hypothetical protein [Acidobacteriota bacterium]
MKDLPLVNSRALDLARIAAACIPTGSYINGANEATIAGVSIANLNIQRDGADVSDVRFPAGIHGIHPLSADPAVGAGSDPGGINCRNYPVIIKAGLCENGSQRHSSGVQIAKVAARRSLKVRGKPDAFAEPQ